MSDISDIVVVSPHLDDAVLSAWLVLRDHPGAVVVSCFAGRPDSSAAGGWDRGFASAGDAVNIRRSEDEAALAVTQSRAVHLDLPDVQYRPPEAGLPLEQLTQVLRRELAGAEQVWLPAGIGGHVDHLLARAAALATLIPEQRAFLYADLPYAAEPGWPPIVSAHTRDWVVNVACRWPLNSPARKWSQALRGLPAAERRIRLLSAADRRGKMAALGSYSSQLSALRCGPGHPLRTRRLLQQEVSWSLR